MPGCAETSPDNSLFLRFQATEALDPSDVVILHAISNDCDGCDVMPAVASLLGPDDVACVTLEGLSYRLATTLLRSGDLAKSPVTRLETLSGAAFNVTWTSQSDVLQVEQVWSASIPQPHLPAGFVLGYGVIVLAGLTSTLRHTPLKRTLQQALRRCVKGVASSGPSRCLSLGARRSAAPGAEHKSDRSVDEVLKKPLLDAEPLPDAESNKLEEGRVSGDAVEKGNWESWWTRARCWRRGARAVRQAGQQQQEEVAGGVAGAAAAAREPRGWPENKRVVAIDVLKGSALCLWVFAGAVRGLPLFTQGPDFTMSISSLAFPWMAVAAGCTMAFSGRMQLSPYAFVCRRSGGRYLPSPRDRATRLLLLRGFSLVLLGLFLNKGRDLSTWRVFGPLQTLGIGCIIVQVLALYLSGINARGLPVPSPSSPTTLPLLQRVPPAGLVPQLLRPPSGRAPRPMHHVGYTARRGVASSKRGRGQGVGGATPPGEAGAAGRGKGDEEEKRQQGRHSKGDGGKGEGDGESKGTSADSGASTQESEGSDAASLPPPVPTLLQTRTSSLLSVGSSSASSFVGPCWVDQRAVLAGGTEEKAESEDGGRGKKKATHGASDIRKGEGKKALRCKSLTELYGIEWMVFGALIAVMLGVEYGSHAPDCPVNYSGIGGRYFEGGAFWACTGGIRKYVDESIFDPANMAPGISAYGTGAFDEFGVFNGLLTLPLIYAGLLCGRCLRAELEHGKPGVMLVAAVGGLILAAGLLCQALGAPAIPALMNPPYWALSLGSAMLLLGGAARLLETGWWTGQPVAAMGCNSLLVYAGHLVCKDHFPLSFKTDGSLAQTALQGLAGVAVWAAVGAALDRKGVHLKV